MRTHPIEGVKCLTLLLFSFSCMNTFAARECSSFLELTHSEALFNRIESAPSGFLRLIDPKLMDRYSETAIALEVYRDLLLNAKVHIGRTSSVDTHVVKINAEEKPNYYWTIDIPLIVTPQADAGKKSENIDLTFISTLSGIFQWAKRKHDQGKLRELEINAQWVMHKDLVGLLKKSGFKLQDDTSDIGPSFRLNIKFKE